MSRAFELGLWGRPLLQGWFAAVVLALQPLCRAELNFNRRRNATPHSYTLHSNTHSCSPCLPAAPEEAPPVEEVLGILRGWQALPKATLLKAFEAGNFAGEGQL